MSRADTCASTSSRRTSTRVRRRQRPPRRRDRRADITAIGTNPVAAREETAKQWAQGHEGGD